MGLPPDDPFHGLYLPPETRRRGAWRASFWMGLWIAIVLGFVIWSAVR